MKTSHILTTTSLAALLASLGLIACGGAEVEPASQTQGATLTPATPEKAPQAMGPEAAGDHHGPRGGRFHGPPTPEKMIERFDANKNGTLEASELPERMQEHIGEIDTSGDSVVSKDELAAHFKTKFMAHAKERFDRQDANHDGVLEQGEVGERWAKFSVADANGDQKLSPEELKAAFESGKLKPMRGEHGGRWGKGGHEAPATAPPAAAPAK